MPDEAVTPAERSYDPTPVTIYYASSYTQQLATSVHEWVGLSSWCSLRLWRSAAGNAPVSKAIVLASVTASILSQASRASARGGGHNVASGALLAPLIRSISPGLAFQNPGDLLFGSFLLYYFRVLERQLGSSKYGAFVVTTLSVSWALQRGVVATTAPGLHLPTGPYGLIFASFVQFFANVPALSKFNVLGWTFSDKAFIYLAGLQLCLSGGVRSLTAAGAGLLAGLLYRSNLLGTRKWKIPGVISRALSRTIGRILDPQVPATSTGRGHNNNSWQPQHGSTGPRSRGGLPRYGGVGGPAAELGRPLPRGMGGGPERATGGRQEPATEPVAVSQEAVEQLIAMGFEPSAARAALQASHNDVQAAISLLL